MSPVFDFHKRHIESPATEVVHQNTFRFAGAFGAVTVLNARGRRLIQKSEHSKARALRRLDGQVALIRVRIGRDAEHDLDLFTRFDLQARAFTKRLGEGSHHFREQIDEGQLLLSDLDARCRPGILENAFQRTHNRHLRLHLGIPGFPAVKPLLTSNRD
jgi:hypothetical protein